MNAINVENRLQDPHRADEKLAAAARIVRELEEFLTAATARATTPAVAGGWRWPVRYNRVSSVGKRS